MTATKNPSLTDVQARRAEIATTMDRLLAEDKELAMAESALIRLFRVGDSEPPPPPAPPAVPLSPSFFLKPTPATPPPPQSLPLTFAPKPPPPLSLPPTPAGTTSESAPVLPPTQEDEVGVIGHVKRIMTGKETLEDLIFLMLDNCGDDWWSATEIQFHASEIRGKEVPMSSVSPTLTLMKNKGILVRDGLKVALASRFENEEAAAE